MKLRLAIVDLRLSIGLRKAAISAFCVGAFGVSAFGQSGGDLVIKKRVIASGGGVVTGGDLRVTGTVGQHDAGPISGGDFVVHGGFWSPGAQDGSPPIGLVADPSGLNKTRFISFSAGGTPGQIAIRVHLTSLHHVVPPYSGGTTTSFDAFEGQSMWVGPPTQYSESTSGGPQFNVSRLRCTPHYRNWGTVGLVHVTSSAIAPSSIYHAEMLAGACQGVEDSPACSPGGANVPDSCKSERHAGPTYEARTIRRTLRSSRTSLTCRRWWTSFAIRPVRQSRPERCLSPLRPIPGARFPT